MKKILFLTACMLLSQISFCRMLEIKLLNTPNIMIDGKEHLVGDKFDERATIKWAHEKQAMKVLSEDNKLYVLSPGLFTKYRTKSFADYVTNVKSTFVRNAGSAFPVSVDDHEELFENDFVLMDSIVINVGWKVDENSFFEARTTNLGDDNFSFVIPVTENGLVLDRTLFSRVPDHCGIVQISVQYVEKQYGETTPLTDSMTVEIVPIKLDELD